MTPGGRAWCKAAGPRTHTWDWKTPNMRREAVSSSLVLCCHSTKPVRQVSRNELMVGVTNEMRKLRTWGWPAREGEASGGAQAVARARAAAVAVGGGRRGIRVSERSKHPMKPSFLLFSSSATRGDLASWTPVESCSFRRRIVGRD